MDRHNSLFQSQVSGKWILYPPLPVRRPSRCGHLPFKLASARESLPPSPPMFRASIHHQTDHELQAIRGPLTVSTTLPQSAPSPSPLLSHPYYSFLYSSLTVSEHQKMQLVSAFQQGILLACCDGSYDPANKSASYGMVFGTAMGPILRVSGPCPGHPSQFSAIRSEYVSINASVFLLLSVCSSLSISGGSVILYNDCSKAHKQIYSRSKKFKRYIEDEYDVLTGTWEVIRHLEAITSFSLVWVKGHYSRKDRSIQHDLNDAAHQLAAPALGSTQTPFLDASPPTAIVTLRCDFTLSSKWQAWVQERSHADS